MIDGAFEQTVPASGPAGLERQLSVASQPAARVEPSEVNLKVRQPAALVADVTQGTVVPEYTPSTGALVLDPLYMVRKSYPDSVAKELKLT